MTKYSEIVESLRAGHCAMGNNHGGDILQNTNHLRRRLFRCWMDGSYNGFETYQGWVDTWKDLTPAQKRAAAINQWSFYIAADFDCSPGAVQKTMVREFTPVELEDLNEQLISDMEDILNVE